MTEKKSLAFGLWESPISPLTVAQGKRFSEAQFDTDGHTLVWLEGRGDRGVLVAARDDDPAPRDLTADISVRANVGYGGGDFCVGRGLVIFAAGGRLYRQELAGGLARPITPTLGAVSTPVLSPDGRWVLFVQSDERVDCLVLVDSQGGSWPIKLSSGRDFYMQPRWHPSGQAIAWIAWDHPHMPWDDTELWYAAFDAASETPRLADQRRLARGPETAIYQPEFSPDGKAIAYVSDATGWGQLYLQPLDGGATRCLTDGSGEYGRPAWVQGQQAYAFLDDRRILAVRGRNGFQQAELIAIQTAESTPIAGMDAYASIAFVASSAVGGRAALVASGPGQPPRVVRFDAHAAAMMTVARSSGETVLAAALAQPRAIAWTSFDGETAHGLFYAPVNETAHSSGKPPLIALIHGGPTSQVTAAYDPQAQFLATRGYAVLQVNYRGSTGYGRTYMLKLRRSWGTYDVEDARTGCLWLAQQGLVDERRRVIMGGSAGGYTALQSLVTHPGFYTAGVSLYGVSNQFTLVTDTHKFEERYSDSLLGPLPEAAALYRERSPIYHAERIKDPIAVYQGDIDQVVPRAQSDEIVASLRARGVPHEYTVYEGEGHGWRKTETVERFYASLDRFLRQYVVFA